MNKIILAVVALVAAPGILAAVPAEAVSASGESGPLLFQTTGGTEAEPWANVHIHSPRSDSDHHSTLPFRFGSYATTATYVSMSVQRMDGSVPIYRGRVTCSIRLNGVAVVHHIGTLGHVTCRALVGR